LNNLIIFSAYFIDYKKFRILESLCSLLLDCLSVTDMSCTRSPGMGGYKNIDKIPQFTSTNHPLVSLGMCVKSHPRAQTSTVLGSAGKL